MTSGVFGSFGLAVAQCAAAMLATWWGTVAGARVAAMASTKAATVSSGLSDGRREYGLGWRLDLVQGGRVSMEFGLETTQRETAGDNAQYGFGFRVTARW